MKKPKEILACLFCDNKIRLWKLTVFFSVVLFLFLAIFVTATLINKNKDDFDLNGTEAADKQNDYIEKKCPDCVRRNIDGIFVAKEDANPQPIAVMIDNHPAARPALGLDKASLVYEAEVEGNYTRYMAVFASPADYGEIGPVRSARPYFVLLAKELNAIYSHCGGSPKALVDIINENINDLNEFYNGEYFWRDKIRFAPYNVITSGANLEKFAADKKLLSADFIPWLFKEDVPLDKRGRNDSEIKINFNSKEFIAGWRYNREDNNYIRLLKGKEQLTAESDKITAKNIILQTIPAEIIDEKLRLFMDITGSGEAVICMDGKCEKGEWRKADFDSRTKFYKADNQEVEFNAGTTWVEIIRPEVVIEY